MGLIELTRPFAGFAPGLDLIVRGLAADARVAWTLTELRGLTVREAADVLGVDFSTVSRRAESARLTLQKELS